MKTKILFFVILFAICLTVPTMVGTPLMTAINSARTNTLSYTDTTNYVDTTIDIMIGSVYNGPPAGMGNPDTAYTALCKDDELFYGTFGFNNVVWDAYTCELFITFQFTYTIPGELLRVVFGPPEVERRQISSFMVW